MSNEQTEALEQALFLLDTFAGEGIGHVYGNGQELDSSDVCTELADAFDLQCEPGWHRVLAARLTAPPSPSTDTLERREAIAVGLSDKMILRLDIGEDDPRLSKIIDELRADLAALSLPAREVTWPPAFQEEYRNRDLDTPERYSVLLAREVSGERDDAFEESVVSLHRYDTATDRERAKEAVGIARLRALATTPAPREKLEADLAEAKKALEPFADAGEYMDLETDGFMPGDKLHVAYEDHVIFDGLKFGDFELARATLNRLSGEG